MFFYHILFFSKQRSSWKIKTSGTAVICIVTYLPREGTEVLTCVGVGCYGSLSTSHLFTTVIVVVSGMQLMIA